MHGYGLIAHALSLFGWVNLARNHGGESETDYFRDMGFYLIRRDETVILEKFASCWRKLFNLFVVPRNVFGESISLTLIVGLGRGQRHCVFVIDLNEEGRGGGGEEMRWKKVRKI